MGTLLLELVPSALGLALTPTAIVFNILFLGSKHPVRNSLAFAAPFVLVYGGIAAVVLTLAQSATGPLIGQEVRHLIGTGVGLVLLLLAGRSYVSGRRLGGAVRRPSRWMEAIEDATVPLALGFGAALALLNPNVPILIAGLATVAAADVSSGGRLVGAALLVGASVVGLLGITLWYLSTPGSAAEDLVKLKAWLTGHTHSINIAVLLVFGVVFTVRGIVGLLTT